MNQTNSKKVQALMAAVVFAMVMFAMNSMAANFTLGGNDGSGTSSFTTGNSWIGGAPPAVGNTYFTASFGLRTPADGNPHIFLGDSLTISNATAAQFPGISIVCKGTGGSTVTVTNLIVLGGGIGNANNQGIGQINRVAGNMNVISNLLISDINGGPRWVAIDSTLSGSGAISNQCFFILSGNNTNFFGALQAGTSPNGSGNGTILVTNEAAMGGNPPIFSAAQLYLNGGTFQPQASFALDHANAGVTIGALGGMFDIASGLTLTNAEALAGTGTLALTNIGTVLQNGSVVGFTGTLSVNKGAFIQGPGSSLVSSVTVANGTTFDVSATGLSIASGKTLAGDGTVTGAVTAGSGSKISPGGSGIAANVTLSSTLTLTGGATLACDFLSTNDVIVVNGNLSASGVTVIQPLNVPAVGTYPIITVAGMLGGAPANYSVSALSTRNRSYSIIYDSVSSPKRVLLQVSSTGTAANLVWVGDSVNNLWDLNTSSNWLNGVNHDVYFDSDTNNFTDAGVSNQPVLNVTVNPGAVYFNNTISNYNLIGSGAIAGQTTVNMGGSAAAIISTTNTYTGGSIVTNGTLTVGTVRALGAPSGSTLLASVSQNGTLDIDGMPLDANYTNVIQINGNGSSPTKGAIDNEIGGLTSGTGDTGIATLSLAGNSTVSAVQNWQIGNTGSGIVGNGFTLTKIGNNYLYLKHAAANSLGGLVIAGGGVLFWDHSDGAGATAAITLTNGGFIDTWNPGNNFNGLTFNNTITVNDAVNGGYIMSIRNPTFNHPGYDIYNGNVTLANGNLTVSNVTFLTGTPQTFGRITINGNVSGQGGIIAIGGITHFLGTGSPEFFGGNLVTLNGNNSYSGPTLVTNLVQLLITTANQSGGNYDIVDYGTLDVAVAAGHPTIPMSNLILEQVNEGPANIGFTRLASMPSSPVIYATNLNINAGVILPPTAGYSVGQFPLIKYNGTIGGNGFGGLALGTLPAGVTATLVDNSGNHTIDLQVTTAGIQWTGVHSTNWDIGSTVNWFNPVSVAATTYADGQTVVFGDHATNYLVNITQAVQPGGVTVNSASNYTFSASTGNGIGINGTGALIKSGSGTLFITSSNDNFTGGTIINGGTIMLCDSNFTFPYGGGALNNNLGNVTIGNGGTLDINSVQVPNFQSFGPEGYNVFVSGTGVGGNGALVNNNTNQNDLADPGYVTLTGDATVGGPGDINIRMGVAPQMSSQSGNYTLTKVGAGQFRIRYLATVSTNFGPISILQGNFTYESTSALGLGDATKNIVVGAGGGFGWGTVAAHCVRPLICSNTATILSLNSVSNVFDSPVTLASGNVNLNANFYLAMTFSNVLSGPGGITLLAQSRATLAASNTYTGNTIVADCNAANGGDSGSILKLAGVGSINNSPSISMQGVTPTQAFPGAIDASGRTDGTLTLLSGQTLRGDNGSWIKGNVIASSGSTINPGGITNIQFMTFSNNLTMASGTVVRMDVSLDGGNGATNDLIRVVGTNTYAGTLVITNSGVTALTNGAAFKLFSSSTNISNFTTVSGTPGAGLNWSFNPTNGVATVIGGGGPATNPTNITVLVSGGVLTLSWPADHLGWTLQSQTNSATSGISTNWFDVIGSSASTQAVLIINPANPNVFFRLRL